MVRSRLDQSPTGLGASKTGENRTGQCDAQALTEHPASRQQAGGFALLARGCGVHQRARIRSHEKALADTSDHEWPYYVPVRASSIQLRYRNETEAREG